ncbi:hypothetical protein GGS23DRAFT_78123 [Durotheca rogersii]|uniref:uncharacterized protein n=1 Tax=Durotheca rogersii TaxID=419775 RepID=UPI00221EF260|nr:uncharacterized protein GGS23DRAFT_78123 [Durotheca rogersii]KAI5862484.1 hypothetical protein GGS23DRAFT_78123 [Durotheca rogersii]
MNVVHTGMQVCYGCMDFRGMYGLYGCACAHIHTHTCAYIHTYIHTCLPVYTPTCVRTRCHPLCPSPGPDEKAEPIPSPSNPSIRLHPASSTPSTCPSVFLSIPISLSLGSAGATPTTHGPAHACGVGCSANTRIAHLARKGRNHTLGMTRLLAPPRSPPLPLFFFFFLAVADRPTMKPPFLRYLKGAYFDPLRAEASMGAWLQRHFARVDR